MRALITGANGFVGSSLCKMLSARGHEVTGLTRDPKAAQKRIGEGVRLVVGSIADPREIAHAAKDCEVIFHAAGTSSPYAPSRVLRWVDIAGTENVLRAARHERVKRVVYISCADVSLCNEDRMHWDEARVLAREPVSSFARTKLMAEEIALAASDDALEVTALRPAFLWGPGDVDGLSRLADEAQHGGALIYNGGRNILALTHIDNLLEAALAAATAEHAPARAYYITDGEFNEAREILPKLLSAAGVPSKLRDNSLAFALLKARAAQSLGRRASPNALEILRRGRSALFDLSRARKDLNYTPNVEGPKALTDLSAWIADEGGLAELMKRKKPVPRATDVDEQVRAAGGD